MVRIGVISKGEHQTLDFGVQNIGLTYEDVDPLSV